MLRLSAVLFPLLAALVPAPAAGSPQESICQGRDLLVEMEQRDPIKHARILTMARSVENGRSILWKIQRDDRPPSYLFGTIHLSDPRIAKLSKAAETAFRSSQRIALEVDDVSMKGFATAIAQRPGLFYLPEGKSLVSLLSEGEQSVVAEAFRRAKLPIEIGNRFRPWVATLLLSKTVCPPTGSGVDKLPLDFKLAHWAERSGKGFFGLETVETQLEAMASIPEADQVDLLKSGLKMHSRNRDVIETMVRLYVEGQIGTIWAMNRTLAIEAGASRESMASFDEHLLTRRNLGMRNRLLHHLHRGGVFVAVGALHLVGKDGLVTLIRDAGYEVSPLD